MGVLRLVSGLLIIIAFAIADDAANFAPEVGSDAVAPSGEIPGFDGEIPTREQILEMLDSITGISDEDKAKLREDLLHNLPEGPYEEPTPANNTLTQTIVLLSLLSLVALIFVFFMYKLFKVLTERETKREEKKKMKQMKKKK